MQQRIRKIVNTQSTENFAVIEYIDTDGIEHKLFLYSTGTISLDGECIKE